MSPSSVPTTAFVIYCTSIEHLIQAPHLLGIGGPRGDPNVFWPSTRSIKVIPPSVAYQALERYLDTVLSTTQ